MAQLTHFSLFTGIGGIDLAAEWAGFETVGQCEWADYPTKVLEKHWFDIPRWRDIRDVSLESVRNRGIQSIDLISGGFPCQPFSVAGKQKGKGDDRYLWPEMLRVIRELKPTWVLGENVPGILRIAGKTVCEDLEREGYAVAVFNFEAAAIGARHRRERVFFVGHSKHYGLFTEQKLRSNETPSNERGTEKQKKTWEFTGAGRPINVSSIRRSEGGSKQTLANTYGERLQRCEETGNSCKGWENIDQQFTRCGSCNGIWAAEPNVGRVANGVSSRVDRLKCLGNAVVPQQVYPILKAIADIEREGVGV